MNFPLPHVVATRTFQMDCFINPEVSQSVKTTNKELGKLQTFVLNALPPQFSTGEQRQRQDQYTQSGPVCLNQLLGNVSESYVKDQGDNSLVQVHAAIVEDSNFGEVGPSLFGYNLPTY